MRKVLLLWGFISLTLSAVAQSCPPEWLLYTGKGYLYDIQSGHNNRNMSESEFKNYLINTARTNLARQIETQVTDQASLNKRAIEGRTSINYTSNSQFSTQVNLKLVETKSLYDTKSKEGYAIAYIDKQGGLTYYKYDINHRFETIENQLSIVNNYIETGFKGKAKEALKTLDTEFSRANEALSWLGFLGLSATESAPLLNRFSQLNQQVKNLSAQLQHGTVIYLSCKATLFGKPYPALQNELKGILSREGCSFTNDPAQADWVIRITASSREYNRNQVSNQKFYFAYADASICIDKQLTSQRIYEDEVSEKGGHTLNFSEAVRKAYKTLYSRLGTIILETIKQ